MREDGRSKFFSFIVFTEGNKALPEFWKERIDSLQVPWVISPLHDRDIFFHDDEHEDGDIKRSHFHCLIDFGALKTIDNVEKLFSSVGMLDALPSGKPFMIPPNKNTAIRYMAHLDCKPFEESGKYRYNPDDIDPRNGYDIKPALEDVFENSTDMLIDEMIDFVVEHKITEYKVLLFYARNKRPDWRNALYHSCTYVMKAFMQSCSNSPGTSYKIEGMDEYNDEIS